MSTLTPMSIDPGLAKRLRQSVTQLDEAKTRRNRLIAEAVASGGSLREVGALVDLSHTQVRHICELESSASPV